MRTALAVAAILCTVPLAMASPPDVPLKPGQYVITASVEMDGRALGTPKKSSPRCLTAADMRDPESVFSPNAYSALGRNTKCQVTNLASTGAKFTYVLDCPLTTDHVEVVLSGDSFHETRAVASKSGRGVSTFTKAEGNRIGDCAR